MLGARVPALIGYPIVNHESRGSSQVECDGATTALQK